MGSKTFTRGAVLGLYTETSLHCGAESGTGHVDLPVQRERHTAYPVIQGSTIKGVLRDEAWSGLPVEERREKVRIAFGSEDAKRPGSVSFGDGLLVAFPVRSSGAPFHWVTCPFVLERVFRLLEVVQKVTPPAERSAWGASGGEVLLEEIRLTVKESASLFGKDGLLKHLLKLLPSDDRGFAYTRQIFLDRLLVVTDQDFRELVETGTEVVTRIKLNALGTTTNLVAKEHPELTVKEDLQGNLFVEELVPPETLFACALRSAADPAGLLDSLPALIRLGGDETIGRGLTHVTRADEAAGEN
jgi:CRISPR-associated protein Cmr4